MIYPVIVYILYHPDDTLICVIAYILHLFFINLVILCVIVDVLIRPTNLCVILYVIEDILYQLYDILCH